ncbi:hypothetical protein RRG08_021662 [Elysia crispata]|uniref:Uncharacterized protein n=1 Tax=Elysia crispata TaxID=231223 RepID=A0AAE0XN81_9GAST|nr:hypothetical protein RRG08_021662 [Elysia crispata]
MMILPAWVIIRWKDNIVPSFQASVRSAKLVSRGQISHYSIVMFGLDRGFISLVLSREAKIQIISWQSLA